LAVDRTTITKWLQKLREAKREEQERQVMELYLQGYTQRQIAEQVRVSLGKVNQIVHNVKIHILESPPKPSELWLYTYRLMPKMDNSTLTYLGNLPPQIVEN
jgi:FixJ family two-component response regulator